MDHPNIIGFHEEDAVSMPASLAAITAEELPLRIFAAPDPDPEVATVPEEWAAREALLMEDLVLPRLPRLLDASSESRFVRARFCGGTVAVLAAQDVANEEATGLRCA
eukprot:TRINITY_DN29620_c0_g1_i5.p1 TRINITY_DN29620_c0_g1~~TRINITY_DN29620_c0_g1_i5.p1  ORF type:complete len:108 (+),score=18.74 TRINITY_DN29620_c0_g1_i5:219-542(+)